MFFLGAYLERDEGTARVVVVEKGFYSGTKRYRIVHAETLQEKDRDALTRTLLDMRLDERWTAVKKVFSQSGRPPKTKKEPPLILLTSRDDVVQMAEAMRRRCASVEVLLSTEPDQVVKQRLKSDAFHNCHVVTLPMIRKALETAMEKGSLNADELKVHGASPLYPLAEALLTAPHGEAVVSGDNAAWFCALGGSIWHGESIRRVKRY
ncbi:hypothetical protein [Desulfoluna spongiiphila]|uniref:hypothetical protein n=1 Tax=Desulfoluna spongiiphila TaxID=419481 RepID=UPI00125BC48C|nr:hypothetical protein [Desulfoluna spongiiphila]VVS95680.1 hypothetical protein DBB_52570 [Desulfoluna spongiiphila]